MEPDRVWRAEDGPGPEAQRPNWAGNCGPKWIPLEGNLAVPSWVEGGGGAGPGPGPAGSAKALGWGINPFISTTPLGQETWST